MALGTPHSVRKTKRHEETRREILEAAWRLVRSKGLAGLSLHELATEVGMRAPSLYSYFASKHAIYDAMFAEGNRELIAAVRAAPVRDDADAIAALRTRTEVYVAFCVADPARYQLLFQRTIPGFEPSAESYAIAVELLTGTRAALADIGITGERELDLWTALVTGLVDQQISNDPGGTRWSRLLPDAIDMYLHHVLAGTTRSARRPAKKGRTA